MAKMDTPETVGRLIDAHITSPAGLAVDSSGNLYIADAANQRIRKVSANGIITTVAGNGIAGYSGDGGPATSAALQITSFGQSPSGVVVDTSGNLYIADTWNSRVRKVSLSGTITTVAGTGGAGYSGDGGPLRMRRSETLAEWRLILPETSTFPTILHSIA